MKKVKRYDKEFVPNIPVDIFHKKNAKIADFPSETFYKNTKDIPFKFSCNLNNTVDWGTMLSEAMRLSHYYVEHRRGESHKGWESLCIHGLSSVHIGSNKDWVSDEYNDKNKWTDVSYWTPTITEFVKSLQFTKLARVRLMKVKAGGWISPHADGGAIGALNIALNNPIDCNFVIQGFGILPFYNSQNKQNPRIILPNIGYVHSVKNSSNQDRFHIIIHGKRSETTEKILFQRKE